MDSIIAGIEDVDLVDLIERIDDIDGVRLRDNFGVRFVEVIGIAGGKPCNCDCDITDPGLRLDHCDNLLNKQLNVLYGLIDYRIKISAIILLRGITYLS